MVRLVRMTKAHRGLRKLIEIFISSIPDFLTVSGIVIIILFIYAVVGMQLFASVAHGEFINRNANFDDFGTTFMTLFRMLTGEDWQGLMHDCLREPCSPQGGGRCLVCEVFGAQGPASPGFAAQQLWRSCESNGRGNAETTPAGAPAAAADRTQRPDATCEGKSG